MDFYNDLCLALQACDYASEKKKIIADELRSLNSVYPDFYVAKGWGENGCKTISVTGTVIVNNNNALVEVLLSLCFPQSYPQVPPLCKVVAENQNIIIRSKYIDSNGIVSVDFLRNWNSNSDSLDVIQKCCDYFEQHIPIMDIKNCFLSEMWRVSTQIDELCREKNELTKSNLETKENLELLKVFKSTDQCKKISENMKSFEDWEKKIINKDITFKKAIVYKHKLAKSLVLAAAEEEAYEETAKKLLEAFYLKSVPASDFITSLKSIYNLKFLAMKKKEKILKNINQCVT